MSGANLVPIGEVAKVRSGYAFRSKDWTDSGVPVVKMANLKDGGLSMEGCSYVPEQVASAAKGAWLEKGNVLVAMTGANTGEVARVRTNAPMVLNQRVGRFLVTDSRRLDAGYLYYALRQDHVKPEMQRLAYGAAQPNISPTLIESIKIPLPPLETQCQIADTLSAYDDLIENNTRRIAILEEMAQRLYREWFVHFRYPGHESVPLVESDLGPIPEGWEVRTLGDVTHNFDSKRRPLSRMQRASMRGEYPYYGAAKVIDRVNDFLFDGHYVLMAEDGTVITDGGKPVIQLVDGRFWVNNHTHVIQGAGIVSTNFLFLHLSHCEISGFITGAAQPKITQSAMNRIPVLVATMQLLSMFDQIVGEQLRLSRILLLQTDVLQIMRDQLLSTLIAGHQGARQE